MAAPGNPTHRLATLLMESHGLAPNVRSTSFSSTEVWSKLYQVGPYFIDVMLGPGDRGLSLRGEIMTEEDGELPAQLTATLHDGQGTMLSPGPRGGATATGASFAFDIACGGEYRVELVLGQDAISIGGLSVH